MRNESVIEKLRFYWLLGPSPSYYVLCYSCRFEGNTSMASPSSSGDFTDRRSVTSLEDLGFSMPLRGSEKPSLADVYLLVISCVFFFNSSMLDGSPPKFSGSEATFELSSWEASLLWPNSAGRETPFAVSCWAHCVARALTKRVVLGLGSHPSIKNFSQ